MSDGPHGVRHEHTRYYDSARGGWVLEAGIFAIQVGSSSRDVRTRGRVDLQEEGLSVGGAVTRLSELDRSVRTRRELRRREGGLEMKRMTSAAVIALFAAASATASSDTKGLKQSPGDLLVGEVMAVAYSGFREGQHPDRGEGAVNPSAEEILEDLEILVAHDFRLIRMYDSGGNTRDTLEIIRDNNLPIKVALGIWLDAEISNHEGCPWLDEPIPEDKLAANAKKNEAEVERAIALANEYANVVVAVNVGNEALVEWNDHMMSLERVIAFVRQVKAAIEQPVTVAENYDWWRKHGAPLAAEVDLLGVHTYPAWEGKTIDEALDFTIENILDVRTALPGKPIVVFEAGWATVASEFGERASEANQARYYDELLEWARATNTTVFFFEAFDEPWKGDPNNPLGAEKHWGLFNVDRTPKQVMRSRAAASSAAQPGVRKTPRVHGNLRARLSRR